MQRSPSDLKWPAILDNSAPIDWTPYLAYGYPYGIVQYLYDQPFQHLEGEAADIPPTSEDDLSTQGPQNLTEWDNTAPSSVDTLARPPDQILNNPDVWANQRATSQEHLDSRYLGPPESNYYLDHNAAQQLPYLGYGYANIDTSVSALSVDYSRQSVPQSDNRISSSVGLPLAGPPRQRGESYVPQAKWWKTTNISPVPAQWHSGPDRKDPCQASCYSLGIDESRVQVDRLAVHRSKKSYRRGRTRKFISAPNPHLDSIMADDHGWGMLVDTKPGRKPRHQPLRAKRQLTAEGREHANEVRKVGACQNCKIRKTKVRLAAFFGLFKA